MINRVCRRVLANKNQLARSYVDLGLRADCENYDRLLFRTYNDIPLEFSSHSIFQTQIHTKYPLQSFIAMPLILAVLPQVIIYTSHMSNPMVSIGLSALAFCSVGRKYNLSRRFQEVSHMQLSEDRKSIVIDHGILQQRDTLDLSKVQLFSAFQGDENLGTLQLRFGEFGGKTYMISLNMASNRQCENHKLVLSAIQGHTDVLEQFKFIENTESSPAEELE